MRDRTAGLPRVPARAAFTRTAALVTHDPGERPLLRLRRDHHRELPTRTHPVIGSPGLAPTRTMLLVSSLTLALDTLAP
ncbi:hypothetical protein E6R60_10295 [Streptomyces sp. A0642]|uniref:hypothetical protein n=1 Tax=Streptomyces sp. A0642 TaxID=2563100 RepID=UPI0010A23615|nr:hypothetical protein [Streptomyces sp. A0642]THA76973.1 hypothetical protein E6R60_10295 [Streptomyces sp. A0642]